MGSDSSSEALFKAVLQAAEQFADATLVVFATQSIVDYIWSTPSLAGPLNILPKRIIFHLVSDVIEMIDEPVIAVRQKKNSSLVVGMRLLKKRYLDAFVSAGNTGALIAGATLLLPLLEGIKRPALLATLPTEKGCVAVIDVGGNVSCKAHYLVQFAQMGAAYQRSAHAIENPAVGLLNIGVESKKGTSEVRRAYQILFDRFSSAGLDRGMHFVGNVEGPEVFQGKVDVLVTDGFTGNILLKTCEGTSSFILGHLKLALSGISDPEREVIVRDFTRHFDYEEYAGAILCGIDCVVVKCHGKSSTKGFFNAIRGAAGLVRNGFINQIKHHLECVQY
jgi:glycerol-3-phosphate acyltransferase PlsX